ncbi:MAG: quinohemoprotein ethanol dehydrogenase [Patiriisocius sp.]
MLDTKKLRYSVLATLFCALLSIVPMLSGAAEISSGNWPSHGLNASETRESPLRQINPDSISTLGLAWSFDTGTRRGLEASPIIIDGVIYTTGDWSRVFANNAKTGELLWQYDPNVDRAWGVNACCDVVNRGVAVAANQVFVGALDGRLIALDSATGRPVWETLTIDRTKPYTITGAPRIVHDTVIIGNGGAEYGVRGYVSAYDIKTGDLRWRFYTVPGNPALPAESNAMEMAQKTWTGDVFWKVGGGGTVWDSMAYDPELDLLYIGVGNGAPWNRHIRSPGGGDNLFLSSIVALNAKTGEYVWHYQTTPADTWDYTATQHMILTELAINGEKRKVILQAPKNGFFYVLDRTTGELISAETYVPITWATHVDIETGRPQETDNADHRVEFQMTKPAPFGGHNWQPMAMNQKTGLVYIPAMENVSMYSTPETFEYIEGGYWNLGQNDDLNADNPLANMSPTLANAVMKHLLRGRLIAWDPIEQKEQWRVEHATAWNGGVLTTAAGLVFQGDGAGFLSAFDASSGERIWQYNVGNGIIAPPVSYEIDGEQYIAVMVGWGGAVGLLFDQPEAVGGGKGRLLSFKLGANEILDIEQRIRVQPEPPARSDNEASVAKGAALYNAYCMRCHGINGIGTGVVADLRYMTEGSHKLFDDIVLKGIFSGLGMVSFAQVLDEKNTADIHNYVIEAANEKWEDDRSSDLWIDIRNSLYDVLGKVASFFL